MEKIDALKAVLSDPSRSQREKEIAAAALKANVNASAPTSDLLQELLLASNKPLPLIPYFEVHAFCSTRGWQSHSVQELFDRWRDAYFQTQHGRQNAARIAEYVRKHDIEEWGYALEQWKDSGWKASERLIDVLERITANCGGIHAGEVVEHAQEFLIEMKRRTAP